jgi:hypothetical protein
MPGMRTFDVCHRQVELNTLWCRKAYQVDKQVSKYRLVVFRPPAAARDVGEVWVGAAP